MKENLYKNLKNKRQREFDEIPLFFAFDKEQFKNGMEKLGLKENDIDKIYSIGGGGYIKISDIGQLKEFNIRADEEMKLAIEQDKDGTGFIKDMFYYELANHEYIITYDLSATLEALDLTMEDIEKSDKLKNGLSLAKKQYFEEFDKSKKKKDKEREDR